MWAEAVHLYEQGERWWLDGILLKYAQEQTKRLLESDPWMEQILLKTFDRSEINIKEAIKLCFPERNIDQISNKDSRRMFTCLQEMGRGKVEQ